MKIYRYEHIESGDGPYAGANRLTWRKGIDGDTWHRLAFNDTQHPTPTYFHGVNHCYNIDERRINLRSGERDGVFAINLWGFGFMNISDLGAWFGGLLDILRRNGFRVVVIEIDSQYVYKDEKQVTYIKKNIKNKRLMA